MNPRVHLSSRCPMNICGNDWTFGTSGTNGFLAVLHGARVCSRLMLFGNCRMVFLELLARSIRIIKKQDLTHKAYTEGEQMTLFE